MTVTSKLTHSKIAAQTLIFELFPQNAEEKNSEAGDPGGGDVWVSEGPRTHPVDETQDIIVCDSKPLQPHSFSLPLSR